MLWRRCNQTETRVKEKKEVNHTKMEHKYKKVCNQGGYSTGHLSGYVHSLKLLSLGRNYGV